MGRPVAALGMPGKQQPERDAHPKWKQKLHPEPDGVVGFGWGREALRLRSRPPGLYGAGEAGLDVGRQTLQSTDEFRSSTFIGNQNGGRIGPCCGRLQAAAQRRRHFAYRTVNMRLAGRRDVDRRCLGGQPGRSARHTFTTTSLRRGEGVALAAACRRPYRRSPESPE